jgi:hypothetical protein
VPSASPRGEVQFGVTGTFGEIPVLTSRCRLRPRTQPAAPAAGQRRIPRMWVYFDSLPNRHASDIDVVPDMKGFVGGESRSGR